MYGAGNKTVKSRYTEQDQNRASILSDKDALLELVCEINTKAMANPTPYE